MVSSSTQLCSRRVDQLIAGLVVANVAWTTWHLGGFLAGPLAVSFAGLGFTLLLVVLRWTMIAPTGLPKFWWLPLPMLGWATGHIMGLAELPGRAWLHGLHLFGGAAAFGIGLHLTRNRQALAVVAVGGGVVVIGAVILALYQRLVDPTWLPLELSQSKYYWTRSSGPFGNPNNFAAWLAMGLPLFIWLAVGRSIDRWRWRIFFGVVAVVALLGIGLSVSRGVWSALIFTALVWPLTWQNRSWPRRLSAMGAVLGAATLLIWVSYLTLPSVASRLDTMMEHGGERTRPHIWAIAVDLWQDRPWVGNGGGSFESLMEKHRPEGLWESVQFAHNDYLNLLSDYGLIGFVLSCGVGLAVLALLGRGRSQPGAAAEERLVSCIGLGGLALAIASLVDFHLQSPAILLLVGLLAGCWVALKSGPPASWSPRFTFFKPGTLGAVWGGGASLLLVGLVLTAVPRFEAEQLRFDARNRLDDLAGEQDSGKIHRVAVTAGEALAVAVQKSPSNESAWADLSYAIALQLYGRPGTEQLLGAQAEQAARQALAASNEVAEFWVRLGIALDIQGRWGEGGLAFGQAVKLAPRQPVVWYYQAFHFSQKPMTHEMAKVALATCLRLDPWYDEAKLLRTALERSP